MFHKALSWARWSNGRIAIIITVEIEGFNVLPYLGSLRLTRLLAGWHPPVAAVTIGRLLQHFKQGTPASPIGNRRR